MYNRISEHFFVVRWRYTVYLVSFACVFQHGIRAVKNVLFKEPRVDPRSSLHILVVNIKVVVRNDATIACVVVFAVVYSAQNRRQLPFAAMLIADNNTSWFQALCSLWTFPKEAGPKIQFCARHRSLVLQKDQHLETKNGTFEMKVVGTKMFLLYPHLNKILGVYWFIFGLFTFFAQHQAKRFSPDLNHFGSFV